MEFKRVMEPEIFVNHIDIEYDEIKADTNGAVALHSAKSLSEQLKQTIVVEDSGLFISTLNGFPGTCSAFVHKRIGLDGLLKLMHGIKNRECFYRSAVAYCEPCLNPMVFLGEEKGTLSESVRGSYGFGHDPIFIPEGAVKTYGEMEDFLEKKKFRRMAVLKLKDYLMNNTKK